MSLPRAIRNVPLSMTLPQPLRIAFGCQARTGKSTAVDYLISQHEGVEMSFAGPLYNILHFAQRTCGFPEEKDRKFLQYIGTEWAREKNPNVWVDVLLRDVEELGPAHNVYVSDVRFPNELTALKKAGFKTVRLFRNDASVDGTFGTGSRRHASETAMDNVPLTEWDYVIENNGTVDEFYSQLDKLVKDFREPPGARPSPWKMTSNRLRRVLLAYTQEAEERERAQRPVLGLGKTAIEYLDETDYPPATQNKEKCGYIDPATVAGDCCTIGH